MRAKPILALLAIIGLSAALSAGCRRRSTQSQASSHGGEKTEERIAPSDAATSDGKAIEVKLDNTDTDNVDYAEKEEIRRGYKLSPNARVYIRGINGRIKIETADTDAAEVLIVRSAKKREELEFRKINIEHTPENLSIRVENDRKSVFSAMGFIPEGRQRVILRLPKQINLETRETNGDVTIGEIRGNLGMHGVNGQIKVARATARTGLSSVNGGIDVTFAPLDRKKVEVEEVNGNVELRFEGEVNADLNSWGINGNLNPELPNVERNETEPRRGRMKARIGHGGTVIEISGVNGNVRLAKAEKSGEAAAKTAAR